MEKPYHYQFSIHVRATSYDDFPETCNALINSLFCQFIVLVCMYGFLYINDVFRFPVAILLWSCTVLPILSLSLLPEFLSSIYLLDIQFSTCFGHLLSAIHWTCRYHINSFNWSYLVNQNITCLHVSFYGSKLISYLPRNIVFTEKINFPRRNVMNISQVENSF